jgi:predicted transglutaminase-like cysteine proteinase
MKEKSMLGAYVFRSVVYKKAAVALFGATMTLSAASASAAATSGSILREGQVVEPPRAYTELCTRRPEICPDRSMARDYAHLRRSLAAIYGTGALRQAPVVLTDQRSQQLLMVNQAVNATIRPVTDRGPDLWSLTSVGGDCEEYVLAKMNMLATMGWPRSAMRITVVRDSQGYHAILVVETDRGGFVLDNMVGHITTARESQYEFIVAESVNQPGAWVRVFR